MLKLLDSYNLAFGCSVQRVWFLEFSFKGVLLKSGLSQISRPLALPCSCFWGCSENSGGIQTYQENGYFLHKKFEVKVAQGRTLVNRASSLSSSRCHGLHCPGEPAAIWPNLRAWSTGPPHLPLQSASSPRC